MFQPLESFWITSIFWSYFVPILTIFNRLVSVALISIIIRHRNWATQLPCYWLLLLLLFADVCPVVVWYGMAWHSETWIIKLTTHARPNNRDEEDCIACRDRGGGYYTYNVHQSRAQHNNKHFIIPQNIRTVECRGRIGDDFSNGVGANLN